MEKKARTIKNSSEEILKLAEKLKLEMDSGLSNVLDLLRVATEETGEIGAAENAMENEDTGLEILKGNRDETS